MKTTNRKIKTANHGTVNATIDVVTEDPYQYQVTAIVSVYDAVECERTEKEIYGEVCETKKEAIKSFQGIMAGIY